MVGQRLMELAGPSRVGYLLEARNARAVRRKDGRLVEIQLGDRGDDSKRKPRRGNPLRYSHNQETGDNPTNVWTLKRAA